MIRLSIVLMTMVAIFSGCSLASDKFDLDPGLDGCVTIHMTNFTAGPVHADKVNYHRVNEKCKDILPHPQAGGN